LFQHPVRNYIIFLRENINKHKNLHGKRVHVCLTCGTYCAYYRVTFYWRERSDYLSDGVPDGLCEDFNEFRCVMKGTNQSNPRCVALLGTIGKHVFCKIYWRRPSICREIVPSYKKGYPEIKWDKARLAYGLPPLTAETWKYGPLNDNTSPDTYSPAA